MNPNSSPALEPLEGRRLFASGYPLGINFNDEATSGDHFAYSVAEARKLGIGAVRLWMNIKSFADRPNAWDSDPRAGAVDINGELLHGGYQTAINRAFQLKHLGFKVMLTVVTDGGFAPASAAEVSGFMEHLINVPQVPGGTEKLRDAVDQWEIGNEPDLKSYWQDSGSNVTTGLQSYVDKFLLPASSVLHSGPAGSWEQVVSGGVSNKPADLNTILAYLKSKNRLDAIDYAGFHPYGNFNPDVPGSNQQATNILEAKGYADAAGKAMIATEWNVRGFSYTGSDDVKWAKAVDLNFRNYILPNFDSSYYFALVNNFAARGGSVSARPAGLLKHTGYAPVSPTSSPDIQSDFYASSMLPAEPYYSAAMQWQYGSISGNVTGGVDSQPVSGARVFIDLNASNGFDVGEPATLTDAQGNYVLVYSARDVPAGPQLIGATLPGELTAAYQRIVTAGPLANATLIDFPLNANGLDLIGPGIGSISGVVWHDFDGNGVLQDLERAAGEQYVYLDMNENGALDPFEPGALSAADTGVFTIAFDAAMIDGVPHAVRINPADGWTQTAAPMVVLSEFEQRIGTVVGIDPPFDPSPRIKGSISGTVWSDTNGNGVLDGVETVLANRIVYIDANNNGLFDTGEYGVLSNPLGVYYLRNMQPGAYIVRAVTGADESIKAPVSGWYDVPLATDDRLGNFNFGLGQPLPASIRGIAWGDPNANGVIDAGEARADGRTIYIDTNRNNKLDSGERSTVADAQGVYKFTLLTAGTYYITRVFPAGYRLSNSASGYLTITVVPGENVTTANIGSVATTTTPPPPPPPPGGGAASISGILWGDPNANGTIDSGEARAGARVVYIDANLNGKLDSGEKQTTSDAQGVYSFKSLAAGTYYVRRVFPAGYMMSNSAAGYLTIALADGQSYTTANIGSVATTTVPPPPPPGESTASITGYLWGDDNANGTQDGAEARIASRVVYIDANNNNWLDAGEKSTTTDSAGVYKLTGLAAGTYRVRRVLPNGYKTVAPSVGYQLVTLTAAQAATGINLGSKLA
ncbi:MAG: hypothetical protein H7144_13510 [Burkholderiales bacterium]|nr:hypothetical protein [Phycisphaerae bacterium]